MRWAGQGKFTPSLFSFCDERVNQHAPECGGGGL